MILTDFEIEVGPSEGEPNLERFVPNVPCNPEDVLGRTVTEVIDCVGTYGMGGAGMVALRLDGERKTHHQEEDKEGESLVFALWGADDHIMCSNPVEHIPSISSNLDAVSKLVVGKRITEFLVEPGAFRIVLDKDTILELNPGAQSEITTYGEDGEDSIPADLRNAVFLSPTVYLWI